MKLVFPIIILSIAFASCQPSSAPDEKTEEKKEDTAIKEIEEPIDTVQPKIVFDPEQYAMQIDSLINDKKGKISTYAWFKDQIKMVKLKKSENDGDEIFVIFQNEAKQIQYIACYPQSQSGDWFEVEEYTFDTLGRTVRHKFHHSTFVSDNCGEARINIIRWFDEKSLQIKEEKKQSDFEEKTISDRNCFPNLEVKSAVNLEELLSRPGLRKVVEKVRKLVK